MALGRYARQAGRAIAQISVKRPGIAKLRGGIGRRALSDYLRRDHFKIQRGPNDGDSWMVGTIRKGGAFGDHNFRATADAFIYSKRLIYFSILRHALLLLGQVCLCS